MTWDSPTRGVLRLAQVRQRFAVSSGWASSERVAKRSLFELADADRDRRAQWSRKLSRRFRIIVISHKLSLASSTPSIDVHAVEAALAMRRRAMRTRSA